MGDYNYADYGWDIQVVNCFCKRFKPPPLGG